ncbi:hypothetical protein IW140_003556 [Coemansia sp. RSA 1813]|nr:hypothetical protein EV178_003477 [Coemansia sp. RSA 1646]KAJ1769161.1 hypothetical protein LPJ74_004277 [Coemansia sp. RSA 1843]KAJ2089134.1 hypothetical protein IW138_003714 [Coemansia sp. RSA 986]KAJ2215609.1 hypothetical protein EV179_002020 [Coemansia sp. RSA 487]KAJ2568799.1 hypothetical protein IW140_003556 [Coemansia sp. RSA 1813]
MAPNMATASENTSLPLPKDLSDIFVPAMRAHKKSAFKSVMGNPTSAMINMAGGVPHPSTFPILQLQAKVASPTIQREGALSSTSTDLVLEKSQRSHSTESLDELLQYGAGCGIDSYCSFLKKYTQIVHSPKYADWGVIASCGNTDAIGKAVSLFCEAGDSLLVEKWTFPGALSSLVAAKVQPVPVDMDGEGMDPDSLDGICTNWSGEKPLRAMYLVPTGQNPTGATMSLERRQRIYAIACKHNLAIIEDDPYYFLQFAPFSTSGSLEDSTEAGGPAALSSDQQAISLVPSLLSLDVDGRVIRLDSFSKILAPNLRCGWITAPSYILDKLQILNESTILQPSGLTQGLISKLLNDTWGMEGWNQHLRNLRATYTYRRNVFVGMVDKHIAGLVDYVVPSAGMFLWMKVNLGPEGASNAAAMPRLLEAMKKCGVMMAPGAPFCSSSASSATADCYLRAAFALVDVDMFEPALARLAQAIVAIREAAVYPPAVQDARICVPSKHVEKGMISPIPGKMTISS